MEKTGLPEAGEPWSAYQYELLQHPDSIRMVAILPGSSDDSVHVAIQHRTISDMPTCSAVSYEWGSATRDHSVLCEDKELKVTSKLLILLRQLRDSRQRGFLWIDAICIDQNNVRERSQQVQLMRDIYQNAKIVLIWLGEELQSTGEAFETIKIMATECEVIYAELEMSSEYESYDSLERIPENPRARALKSLTKDSSWPGIMDLYSSRTFFERIWVVQEIVLSKRATVMCGGYRISWDMFMKAAKLLFSCDFLQVEIKNFDILGNIYNLGATKLHINNGYLEPSLMLLISAFLVRALVKVSDPRDLIFGLLGMLSEGPQRSSIIVDYTATIEQVFTSATRAIVEYEQTLDFWRYLNDSSTEEQKNLPSWVPTYGKRSALFGLPASPPLNELHKTTRSIWVEGDTLNVCGFIFDIVSDVSVGISRVNILSFIQSHFRRLSQLQQRHNINSFWQALVAFDPSIHDYATYSRGFLDLYAHIEDSKPLTFSGEQYYKQARSELIQSHRRVFQTQTGFFGIGPGSQGPESTLQVGDMVGVIAKADSPMVLRLREDGCYTLVGPCYIGCFEDADCWKEGRMPELVSIRIR